MWVGHLKFVQVTEYMNVVQLGLGGKHVCKISYPPIEKPTGLVVGLSRHTLRESSNSELI